MKMKGIAIAIMLACCLSFSQGVCSAENDALVELGRSLFSTTSLSRDGKTSCQTCHSPLNAYADTRPTSVGVDNGRGTRNAPSLVDISDYTAFFWDGRRSRLEDVVIDPFTNPVELGLASTDDLLARLRNENALQRDLELAFPDAEKRPTLKQVSQALTSFVRSLRMTASTAQTTMAATPSAKIRLGRALFEGVAGCNECHTTEGNPPRYSDGLYHHSGVDASLPTAQLPETARTIIQQSLPIEALGPKILTDANWSVLGRFVVTQRPADLGSFRTPSLRNVALTSPYMHDGSIATLAEAVDHELFYRGFARGHPLNLSRPERAALVAFLETLTEVEPVATRLFP